MTLMEQKVRQYKNDAAGMAGSLPDVAGTYDRFTGKCFEAGVLDARTKQLIALGVALFANNEVCTYYHVEEARSLGASDLQIMETAAVASAAAGGHVMSQGVIRVQGALRGLAGEKVQDYSAGQDPLQHLQKNAFQDTELSDEFDAPGMDIPGGSAISPSY
ncbi:carboxymuconolactone decarboxylase family protein [Cohnella sp. NL03-T5]|nr:carboxymuconolactone decarboxylase family protein [Cohnella silvisoli]